MEISLVLSFLIANVQRPGQRVQQYCQACRAFELERLQCHYNSLWPNRDRQNLYNGGEVSRFCLYTLRSGKSKRASTRMLWITRLRFRKKTSEDAMQAHTVALLTVLVGMKPQPDIHERVCYTEVKHARIRRGSLILAVGELFLELQKKYSDS